MKIPRKNKTQTANEVPQSPMPMLTILIIGRHVTYICVSVPQFSTHKYLLYICHQHGFHSKCGLHSYVCQIFTSTIIIVL